MASSTRDQILASARQAFSTKGIARATVRDIVGGAGANVASVSYYFGSRSGLITELFHEIMSSLHAERRTEFERLTNERHRGRLTPEDVIDVKYWPLFRRFHDNNPLDGWRSLSIVFQVRQDPTPECVRIVSEHDRSTGEQYDSMLAQALDISISQARTRLELVNATAWDTVSNIGFAQKLAAQQYKKAALKKQYAAFRTFSAAGVRASLTEG